MAELNNKGIIEQKCKTTHNHPACFIKDLNMKINNIPESAYLKKKPKEPELLQQELEYYQNHYITKTMDLQFKNKALVKLTDNEIKKNIKDEKFQQKKFKPQYKIVEGNIQNTYSQLKKMITNFEGECDKKLKDISKVEYCRIYNLAEELKSM